MPAYAAVVTNPMDLGTIGARLGDGSYAAAGAAGFAADVRLVCDNAAAFCESSPNGADAVVYRMAQVLRSAFEHRWLGLLESAPRGAGAEAAAAATFAAAPGAAAGAAGAAAAAAAGDGGAEPPRDPVALVRHRRRRAHGHVHDAQPQVRLGPRGDGL